MQTCVFKFVFEIITVRLSYVKWNFISIVLYLYSPHSFKILLPPPPSTDYFGPFFIKWKSSGWDHNELFVVKSTAKFSFIFSYLIFFAAIHTWPFSSWSTCFRFFSVIKNYLSFCSPYFLSFSVSVEGVFS